MQDGLNNLADLLKGDLSDITRFITNPPSGLVDFKRIAAQFGVGGTIVGLTGVTFNFIIHRGDHNGNGDGNGNDGNNGNRGQQTTATASATATSSTSKATPTEWLLNTVRGTSRAAFEDFVSTLPDRGKGKRIIYPKLKYQNYVGKMTLDEAKAVSKNPIVDQIGSNDPMKEMDSRENSGGNPQPSKSTRRQSDRRAVPDGHKHDRRAANAVYQRGSPLHLKMISLPKDQRVSDLNEFHTDEFTEYTYDDNAGGRGSFVYVLDCGFNFRHPVSVVLLKIQAMLMDSHPIPEYY